MTTHTEAAEQYIKNRLGGLVEVDLDAKFDEVNINDEKYKLLKDDDGAGFFDRNGRLFRNNNGKVKLTTGILPPLLRPENTIENSVDLYDFSKPNQKNGESFTEAGRRFYTRQMDESATEDDKTARLIEVEKQLNDALIEDQKRRNKTEKNGSNVPLIIKDSEKVDTDNSEDEKEKAKAFDPELYKGIQKSDRVLQRLSLRNLKYPIDADYGNTQDYVQINQFTYKPVNPEVLFPADNAPINPSGTYEWNTDMDVDAPSIYTPDPETTLQKNARVAKSTLLDGLTMQSPKEEAIGLVKLPMPNQLSDSNNVAWGEDQLNAITAAAATIAAGGLDTGINFLKDIAKGDKGFREAFSSILTGTGDAFNGIIGFLEDAQKSSNANLLARSTVGSSLLNLVGFGVSPEAILARGAGVVPNSNLQLLFNAPTLRAFRFDWKMSPRSREEAIRINNIIRFFKQGMAAKKMQPNSGGGSYFLGTPNVFDITFRTSKLDKEITNENNAVLRVKTCACVGAAVNYTPEGMWNAYEKGQPTSCILSLQFKELEPLFNTDYDEDPFSYGDLTGFIPSDAVGY